MNYIDNLKSRISGERIRIVYPEGNEPRIVMAAAEVAKENIASPILLGNAAQIQIGRASCRERV